ncbi:DUF1877 family protein [Streptomyces cylindrosporus]|uniref:YfbM family protein n=1 Tax=Streptomyces cylindrosporus TaxID=2927583 RepID=A0ABS9YHC4_9ACTN|nr:DUF1877 family protein [Streptomyces cylindrosporus]MCI3275981.1 YfbM family protein [Streptomyces cylindrosporus]
MNVYFHLRAVPPSALRNSANWMQRLFEDDWNAVRERVDRHREEFLDRRYADHDVLYTGADPDEGPRTQVVLGGHPIPHPDKEAPPFLMLTAAQTARVAAFLTTADFESLWNLARAELLPRYGGTESEQEARSVFASTHRDLTAFYAQTAEYGDAVVKWVLG